MLLVKIKNPQYKNSQGVEGKSLNVDLETKGQNADDGELYHLPGVYSKPHEDESGVVAQVGNDNIVIATHNYKLDKDVDKGNILLYSIDNTGTVKGSCLLNQNGEFIVNDGSRSAVAFAELKAGFDQLKTDLNNLITAYNAHVHSGVTTGPGSSGPTPSQGVSSTADIDSSEVDEVLLP